MEIYSPDYRPGKRAAVGQYKGRLPVGIWQVWDGNGRLLGFTDFDKPGQHFERCSD